MAKSHSVSRFASAAGTPPRPDVSLRVVVVLAVGLLIYSAIDSKRGPARPVRAVTTADAKGVYSEVVDGGSPCIGYRSMHDWDGGWKIVARGARNPMLSRDGKQLFYERPEWFHTQIWRMDVRSNEAALFASRPGSAEVRDVDASGGRVIVEREEWGGGKAKMVEYEILRAGGGVQRLQGGGCFTRDGGVAVARSLPTAMMLHRPEGGVETLQEDCFHPESSVDGWAICYCSGGSDSWRIRDLGTGADRPLGPLSSRPPVLLEGGAGIVAFASDHSGALIYEDVITGARRDVADLSGGRPTLRASRGGVVAVGVFSNSLLYLVLDDQGNLRHRRTSAR